MVLSESCQIDRVSALPDKLVSLGPLAVVCGHYGVGKTNFCINLALDSARAGKEVTLIDLDVVNLYFRSSDYAVLLQQAGVALIAPEFAGTALDAPMLSGRIATCIAHAADSPERLVIIDAGGDDVGATALGSFAHELEKLEYAMLYVVNRFREQTTEPDAAVRLLYDIETQAKCHATALVNNSHLQDETTLEHISEGMVFAQKVSDTLQLPISCTTCPAHLVHSVNFATLACDSIYFVQPYVSTPWNDEHIA